MNKKAQAEWSLEEMGKLVLRILAVIVLLVILVGLYAIFTKSKPIDSSVQDFERIYAELSDLNPVDLIIVPIFSTGHYLTIVPKESLKDLSLPECTQNEKYCICLLDQSENVKMCKGINTELDIDDIENEFELIPSMGLTLESDGEKISIS